MPEERSVFERKPAVVSLEIPGERRDVTIHRVTFRHAPAWFAVWAEYGTVLQANELDGPHWTDLAARMVKAGIPEPDDAHPVICPCHANGAGIHDFVEKLDPGQFDELFEKVMEQNRPKASALATSGAEPSTSTRPSRSWSLRGWAARWRSTRR